jgi:hypothetical protein
MHDAIKDYWFNASAVVTTPANSRFHPPQKPLMDDSFVMSTLIITLEFFNMKKTKIIYWIFTSLFALMMFSSAIPDVLSSPVAVKGMHEGLGYPLYFIPFIGVAKILGVAAILMPGYSRIKEWAYAGLFFDLTGATYSIASSGQPASGLTFMIFPIALGICSYIFYHKKQRASPAKEIQLSAPSNYQNKFENTRIA